MSPLQEKYQIDPDGWVTRAKRLPTAAVGAVFAKPPTLLIVHYTASGGTAETDAEYFAKQARNGASAHFVIGRDGSLFQSVPIIQAANHAGRSVWRGRANCNQFSLGIELDNWGPLSRRADLGYYSWVGEKVDPKSVHLQPKAGGSVTAWEVYPELQLAVLEELTRTLKLRYASLAEVTGHENVAPGRKTDPGPAFPLTRFQNLFQPRGDGSTYSAEVWCDHLNVRADPGINAATLSWGPLKKGDKVHVIHDAGEWSYVESENHKNQGWVCDQYLRHT